MVWGSKEVSDFSSKGGKQSTLTMATLLVITTKPSAKGPSSQSGERVIPRRTVTSTSPGEE